MLVFVQVSSMKTGRSGLIRLCLFDHWTRRRAMSGLSRSLATTCLKLSLSTWTKFYTDL
jgi:hypothetical protein